MHTYTATFPLRTISLQLQDKPQTKKEAEAVAIYSALHNELFNMKTHWLACLERVQEQKACLQNGQVAYAALEKETKRYGRLGGFTDDDGSDLEEEEYTLKFKDLQDLVGAYRDFADNFNNRSATLMKMYNEGEELEQAFNVSFAHFDKGYFSPIIADYDNVQVDTFSLDQDVDSFRSSCEEVNDIRESFLEQWEELNPIADELDKKLKAIDRHVQIITRSHELANPASLDPTKAALN